MSYAQLLAPCFACRRLFTSNPERVPSYAGQPICRDCMRLANEKRAAAGRELWPILSGAYEPLEID